MIYVPSNNNYAEHLIRIGILKRTVSGGSMSTEDGNAYTVLLSAYATYRLCKFSSRQFLQKNVIVFIKTENRCY